MVDDSTKNTGGEVAAQGGSIEGEGLVNLTNDVEPDNGGQQQAAAVNQQSENILSNNNLDTPAPRNYACPATTKCSTDPTRPQCWPKPGPSPNIRNHPMAQLAMPIRLRVSGRIPLNLRTKQSNTKSTTNKVRRRRFGIADHQKHSGQCAGGVGRRIDVDIQIIQFERGRIGFA